MMRIARLKRISVRTGKRYGNEVYIATLHDTEKAGHKSMNCSTIINQVFFLANCVWLSTLSEQQAIVYFVRTTFYS